MIATPRLQHISSGGLALAVHAVFLLALMLSLTWKTPPQLPVEADLWAALPDPPMPVLEEVPVPEPQIVPPAPVVPVTPKVNEADIALKKAEQEEKKKLLQEEKVKQERLQAERLEQQRQQQLEKEKQLAEENAKLLAQQAQKRKQLELENAQAMERQRLADSAEEEARMRVQNEQRLQAARRARVVDEFKLKIQTKIQGLVRLPPNLAGNPEAIFQVTLFPNGEIRKATLLKSSGSSAYDVEVERAILRASPLPLPTEKDAAQAFRTDLNLIFSPFQKGQF